MFVNYCQTEGSRWVSELRRGNLVKRVQLVMLEQLRERAELCGSSKMSLPRIDKELAIHLFVDCSSLASYRFLPQTRG